MTEVLNEVDLGEPDQSAPSSDIALSVSGSQKITPSPSALEDRDRRYELRAQQSLTAAFLVILPRAGRRSIGGGLNKSGSPVGATFGASLAPARLTPIFDGGRSGLVRFASESDK